MQYAVRHKLAGNISACPAAQYGGFCHTGNLGHCSTDAVRDFLGQADLCILAGLRCAVNNGLDHLAPCSRQTFVCHRDKAQLQSCRVRRWTDVDRVSGVGHDDWMLQVSTDAVEVACTTYRRRPRPSTPCCEATESRQTADNLHLFHKSCTNFMILLILYVCILYSIL